MNDIIVPAERLAELLKLEHLAVLMSLGNVHNWSGYNKARNQPTNNVEPADAFFRRVEEHLEKGTLAVQFGLEENGDSEVNVVIDDAGDNYCVGE